MMSGTPSRQSIIDRLELLTNTAIKCGDEVVAVPTDLAALAVRALYNKIKHGPGRPRPYEERRATANAKLLAKIRKRKGKAPPYPDAPKYKWGRERKNELAAKHTKAKAAELAAEEMKAKFSMVESVPLIAHRLLRPGKYASG